MNSSGAIEKIILNVTPVDVEYFRQFKPLHYLTLQEMIRHGEAVVINEGLDKPEEVE